MYLKPKKRLGQNFLIDPNIIKKIIVATGLSFDDTVLEIGAGRGELTQLIAPRTKKVYAVEIDSSLCNTLRQRLKDYPHVEIIPQDILKLDLENLDSELKVIGNIPYYLTTPILRHLLKFRHKISLIYISVQKEFAARILAKVGTKAYGAFSCFMQYYTKPENLFIIKRTCFWPVPKVDSCFLKIKIRKKPILPSDKEKLLFRVIRQAFSQRRKTLKNSLKKIIPAEKLPHPNLRPEDLSLRDFINLINS
ncbi:MAG: 16S rRNA (adenine(1518)-N(6)/adenine(1519)-N(6))-dimethyltransferase RsmA [Candidatus Omnitrophica bacterium]|nr:16S rRNA (adenine(1518)-N(6)/adenine(1519)-N(6))-dimethyltransferase RsmA [Candidatus Omnitrophota bacterium]